MVAEKYCFVRDIYNMPVKKFYCWHCESLNFLYLNKEIKLKRAKVNQVACWKCRKDNKYEEQRKRN